MFLDFDDVESNTAQVLADTKLQCLAAWDLSLAYIGRQCYDGGSNVSKERSGCRTIVQQQASMEIYTH